MYYRKYRPQIIADLDNEHIRQTLGKALLENNWAQAYLLTGPRGTGKTTTARLIAKIVNCEKRKKGDEPCNKCDSCLAITNGNALDVVEIDAASNRGIDEIRQLRERVKLAPASLKYKVYIIDEVHMLTTEAFNALLKTLEEPPAHVIFVLATTDVHKLPQTIISRCQHFNFHESSLDETVHALKRVVREEKLAIDESVLIQIAKDAEGSFRDAHKLLEQATNLTEKVTMAEWEKIRPGFSNRELGDFLDLLAGGQKQKLLALIEDYVRSGRRVRDLHHRLIGHLSEVLVDRFDPSKEKRLARLPTEQISELIRRLIESLELARLSPLPQVPLELVVAGWAASAEPSAGDAVAQASQAPAPPVSKQSPEDYIVSDNLEPADEEIAKWAQILAAIKPQNHSLVAFLRAAKPAGKTGGTVVIEVFYKFHKEKLEEKKNRDVIEKVISDIMGRETKIKFTLGAKNSKS